MISAFKFARLQRNDAKGLLVFLHGLGDSGNSFLDLPLPPTIEAVFPHAPVGPVTLNGGIKMPRWYDILSLDKSGPIDDRGIGRAVSEMQGFIDEVGKDYPAEKIVLGGFSQGASLALMVALASEKTYGGVLCLSGFLPISSTVVQNALMKPQSFFFAHGKWDDVVKTEYGLSSHAALHKELGYSVQQVGPFRTYPMAHTLCVSEIADVIKFIEFQLRQ